MVAKNRGADGVQGFLTQMPPFGESGCSPLVSDGEKQVPDLSQTLALGQGELFPISSFGGYCKARPRSSKSERLACSLAEILSLSEAAANCAGD